MVTKFEVYFPKAKENRKIHLYLPEQYYNSTERYPVLYMFDGHNLFFDSDATFGTSMGMKDFMDHWYKDVIIVGIECAKEDLQRVKEYAPYHMFSRIYGEVWGEGDATFRWIENDLKPFIDRRYRTWPQREATALAGYSMGGMMAMYGIIRYNHVFSKAAVISPSVHVVMDQYLADISRRALDPDTRIFFSWGTDEADMGPIDVLAQEILTLEKEVQKKGARTYILCQQGGQHNEGSWRQQVGTWMRFLWF